MRLKVIRPMPKKLVFLSLEAERYNFWGQSHPG